MFVIQLFPVLVAFSQVDEETAELFAQLKAKNHLPLSMLLMVRQNCTFTFNVCGLKKKKAIGYYWLQIFNRADPLPPLPPPLQQKLDSLINGAVYHSVLGSIIIWEMLFKSLFSFEGKKAKLLLLYSWHYLPFIPHHLLSILRWKRHHQEGKCFLRET